MMTLIGILQSSLLHYLPWTNRWRYNICKGCCRLQTFSWLRLNWFSAPNISGRTINQADSWRDLEIERYFLNHVPQTHYFMIQSTLAIANWKMSLVWAEQLPVWQLHLRDTYHLSLGKRLHSNQKCCELW